MNYLVRIQGDALGPFNIYYDTASLATQLLETASRATMLEGVYVEGAPPSATSIIVYNTDPDCQNYVVYSIVPSPTPTVTPSLTPTPSPSAPAIDCDLSGSMTITPTPSPSISINPSITPSVTRTPSVTVTRTPSVTPSVSTPITATIYVSAETRESAPNAGWLQFQASVTSGTTQDLLTFSGTYQRYTDGSCTTGISGGCSFNDIALTAGSTLVTSAILCDYANIGGNSVKILNMTVDGINITSNNQVITVNGRNYRITGFGDCISGI